MGGEFSKLFNPAVAGTGQTAGDFAKLGYSDQDLKTLDPKLAMRQGLVKGALGGLGQGIQAQPSSPGGAIAGAGPAPTPVDASFFAPQALAGNPMSPGYRNPIYG